MTLPDLVSLDLRPNSLLELPLPPTRILRKKKTILFAEDDNDLRYVMESTLAALGYRVIACADGQLASTAFYTQSTIDLLLTDFQMPGKSGIELARELTCSDPFLPVLILTGSTLSTEILQEIQDKRWIYVSKPCRLPSLEASLEQLLLARQPVAAHLESTAA